MKKLLGLALATLLVGEVFAQSPGSVPNHSIPIGRGPGATGFGNTGAGTLNQVLTSQGPSADPIWQTPGASDIQAMLDSLGNTQGNILYRNATQWVVLAPGTAGYHLATGGAGANPYWNLAGTVTSVTCGSGLTGGTFTTSGTCALSTPVPLASGGIGITSGTAFGMPYFGAGGTSVASTGAGTSTQVLHGNAAGAPTWGAVGLTTDVSGVLPIANGGTNCSVASGTCVDNISGFSSTGYMARTGAATYTFSTASQILDSIGTTQGSILYKSATTWQPLVPGVSGTVLTSNGAGANPSWQAVVGTGTVTSITQGGGVTLSTNPCTTTCTTGWDATVATYAPGGTGGLSSIPIQTQLRRYRTAGQYGAVGDGVTDDITAINNCVADSTDGIPCILKGTSGINFRITTSILMHSRSSLIGGDFSVIVTWDGAAGGSMIQGLNAATTNVDAARLADIILDGNGILTGNGINLLNANAWTIERVTVWDTNGAVCFMFQQNGAASTDSSNYHRLIGTLANDCTYGYYFNSLANSNTLIAVRTNVVTYGVVDFGDNNTSFGSQYEQFTYGIYAQASSIGFSSFGDRFENAGALLGTGDGVTCVAGCGRLTVSGPYYAGLATNQYDPSFGVVNSQREYKLEVTGSFSTVTAQSTSDVLVVGSPMNNCTQSDEVTVTAAGSGAFLPAGVMVQGQSVNGGMYIRLANVTSSDIAVGSVRMVLVCRRRG